MRDEELCDDESDASLPPVHVRGDPRVIDSFRFRIAGCGTALPRNKLSNVELAKQLGVETSWIESRCGVETRYKSEGDETTLSLAVEASRAVLAQVPGFVPDMLICSTFTPEYLLCPTAPAIAHKLALGPIGAFDLNAACSGAAIGFLTAINFLTTGFAKRINIEAYDVAVWIKLFKNMFGLCVRLVITKLRTNDTTIADVVVHVACEKIFLFRAHARWLGNHGNVKLVALRISCLLENFIGFEGRD